MRLPNGFGSVHKLPGNRRNPYRVRITIGWKINNKREKIQEYKTLGYFATKEAGIIALSNFNESPYNLNNITFEEVYNLWSREHFEKIVDSSKRIWIAAYNHSKVLYKKRFRDIKVRDLENVINEANVGNSLKHRMKSMYNMMYKYAIKHEFTDKNYATFCEIPKEEKIIERKPFSDIEILKLWENIDMPFVDMILIGIYSGLRPSEIVKLENNNINLKEKTMRGGIKTDAGKNRLIPIHDKIYCLIKNRYNSNNERVFVKENGQNMTYDDYRNRFIKIMKKLNMNHKPHDTRHTFITLAKRYDMNEYILKLIVGHSIRDITEGTYTHRNFEEIKREIIKIKI